MKVGPKEAEVRALRLKRAAAALTLKISTGSAASVPKPSSAPVQASVHQQEMIMSKKSKKKSASRKAPIAKKPRKAKIAAADAAAKTEGGVRVGSKLETIVSLLKRAEGCTTADILAATSWPAVSVPQQAKAAGFTLRKEKEGKVTRYFAA